MPVSNDKIVFDELSVPPAVDIAVPITEQDFTTLSNLVYEQFGIYLPPEKRTMVAVRMQKIFRRLGFQSFQQYHQYLKSRQDREVLTELAIHITTNHTFFYREKEHFEFLTAHALPEITTRLAQMNELDLRVWSAGCSSGEESYMLAMLMMEYFGSNYSSWKAGVLATDLSEKVLATAREGVYPAERTDLVPTALKSKYFKQLSSGDWEVKPHLKKEVVFRAFNLMNPFPFKKPFHCIFCRNVMIYFDQPTREALVEKFYQSLAPGGYLFIGHSETLRREQTLFRYVMPAVYKK